MRKKNVGGHLNKRNAKDVIDQKMKKILVNKSALDEKDKNIFYCADYFPRKKCNKSKKAEIILNFLCFYSLHSQFFAVFSITKKNIS